MPGPFREADPAVLRTDDTGRAPAHELRMRAARSCREHRAVGRADGLEGGGACGPLAHRARVEALHHRLGFRLGCGLPLVQSMRCSNAAARADRRRWVPLRTAWVLHVPLVCWRIQAGGGIHAWMHCAFPPPRNTGVQRSLCLAGAAAQLQYSRGSSNTAHELLGAYNERGKYSTGTPPSSSRR